MKHPAKPAQATPARAPLPANSIDDKIPRFNVMQAVLAKQTKQTDAEFMSKQHGCLDCPLCSDGGCENCEHDWIYASESSEKCTKCHLRLP